MGTGWRSAVTSPAALVHPRAQARHGDDWHLVIPWGSIRAWAREDHDLGWRRGVGVIRAGLHGKSSTLPSRGRSGRPLARGQGVCDRSSGRWSIRALGHGLGGVGVRTVIRGHQCAHGYGAAFALVAFLARGSSMRMGTGLNCEPLVQGAKQPKPSNRSPASSFPCPRDARVSPNVEVGAEVGVIRARGAAAMPRAGRHGAGGDPCRRARAVFRGRLNRFVRRNLTYSDTWWM